MRGADNTHHCGATPNNADAAVPGRGAGRGAGAGEREREREQAARDGGWQRGDERDAEGAAVPAAAGRAGAGPEEEGEGAVGGRERDADGLRVLDCGVPEHAAAAEGGGGGDGTSFRVGLLGLTEFNDTATGTRVKLTGRSSRWTDVAIRSSTETNADGDTITNWRATTMRTFPNGAALTWTFFVSSGEGSSAIPDPDSVKFGVTLERFPFTLKNPHLQIVAMAETSAATFVTNGTALVMGGGVLTWVDTVDMDGEERSLTAAPLSDVAAGDTEGADDDDNSAAGERGRILRFNMNCTSDSGAAVERIDWDPTLSSLESSDDNTLNGAGQASWSAAVVCVCAVLLALVH